MDVDIPIGTERWEQLAACLTFVPLYSRRYFRSEACGREWAAFDLRRRRHLGERQAPPEVIVPAFWTPVPDYELPELGRAVQFKHPALGDLYQERGVRGLMTINRYRDHYRSAVEALAIQIIHVAEQVRLPAAEPRDLFAVKSAFSRDGSRRFQVTIVAHAAGSLTRDRDPRFYGPTAAEWNPFHPSSTRSLADHAADVVRELGFDPEIGTVADHHTELFSNDPPSCPGVVPGPRRIDDLS